MQRKKLWENAMGSYLFILYALEKRKKIHVIYIFLYGCTGSYRMEIVILYTFVVGILYTTTAIGLDRLNFAV